MNLIAVFFASLFATEEGFGGRPLGSFIAGLLWPLMLLLLLFMLWCRR